MSATQRTFLGIDDKLNIHTTWGNVPAQARPLPLRLLAECINTVVYSSKQNLIPVAAKRGVKVFKEAGGKERERDVGRYDVGRFLASTHVVCCFFCKLNTVV